MQYQLDVVRKMIGSRLSPTVVCRKKQPKEYLNEVINEIYTISDTCQQHLRTLLTSEGALQTAVLIPHYQRDITTCLDLTYQYLQNLPIHKPASLTGYIKESYYGLLLRLKALLRYVNQYFQRHCDYQLAIPVYLQARRAKIICNTITKLKNNIMNMQLDPPLSAALYEPLERFADLTNPSSYYGFHYISSYLCQVEILLDTQTMDDVQLANFFISSDMNTVEIFKYIAAKIRLTTQAMDDNREKLIFYCWSRKNIRQIVIESPCSYNTKNDSLKDSLCKWLDEEIDFLAFQSSGDEVQTKQPPAPGRVKKIKLNMSVKEISCCLGLMIKAGLAEDNLNALSGEASQKVSSFSKDDIAAESLRTNAYAKDPGTIRRVIDKIIMLLNEARAA